MSWDQDTIVKDNRPNAWAADEVVATSQTPRSDQLRGRAASADADQAFAEITNRALAGNPMRGDELERFNVRAQQSLATARSTGQAGPDPARAANVRSVMNQTRYASEQSGSGQWRLARLTDIPGGDDILARQEQFLNDPANRGKPLPASLALLQREEGIDGDYVNIHPAYADLLLADYEQRRQPQVRESTVWEDLTTGNARAVGEGIRAETEARRAEPVPLSLMSPEQLTDPSLLGIRPQPEELGAIPGLVQGFTRGSNQLAADVLGGGTELLANAIESTTGRDQSGARDIARARREEFEGVAQAFPASTSVQQGLDPSNWRWWTESMAEQTPAFAAMIAPGVGAGAALQQLGATARATAWTQRAITAGTAFGFEASAAYGDIYDRLRQMGGSDEDARNIATVEAATVGAVNSILETISFGELFLNNPQARGMLQRAVRGFFAEGGTEMLQEISPVLIKQWVEEGKLRPLQAQEWEQALSAALLGGAMGGGVGIAQGGGQQAGPQQPDQLGFPGAADILSPNRLGPAAQLAQADQFGEPGPAGDPFAEAAGASPSDPTAGPGTGPTLVSTPETQIEGGPTVEVAPGITGVVEDVPQTAQDEAGGVPTSGTTSETPEVAPATAQERENVPQEGGEGPTATFSTPQTAMSVARARAAALGRPQFITATADGIRLDQRRPVSGMAFRVEPDGTIEPVDEQTLAQPPATGERRKGVVEPQAGRKYAQSDPVYQAAKKQLRDASYPPGGIIHGTTAQELEKIALEGLKPSGLSGRVDGEQIGPGGKSVGTAIAYAGKGGMGDPVMLVLKPGVVSEDSDGGAGAVAVSSKGRDRVLPADIAGVVFGDGTRIRWSDQEAIKKKIAELSTASGEAVDKSDGPGSERQPQATPEPVKKPKTEKPAKLPKKKPADETKRAVEQAEEEETKAPSKLKIGDEVRLADVPRGWTFELGGEDYIMKEPDVRGMSKVFSVERLADEEFNALNNNVRIRLKPSRAILEMLGDRESDQARIERERAAAAAERAKPFDPVESGQMAFPIEGAAALAQHQEEVESMARRMIRDNRDLPFEQAQQMIRDGLGTMMQDRLQPLGRPDRTTFEEAIQPDDPTDGSAVAYVESAIDAGYVYREEDAVQYVPSVDPSLAIRMLRYVDSIARDQEKSDGEGQQPAGDTAGTGSEPTDTADDARTTDRFGRARRGTRSAEAGETDTGPADGRSGAGPAREGGTAPTATPAVAVPSRSGPAAGDVGEGSTAGRAGEVRPGLPGRGATPTEADAERAAGDRVDVGTDVPDADAGESVGTAPRASDSAAERKRLAQVALANKLRSELVNRRGVDRLQLNRMADEAFGGTQAAGVYQLTDAYEALELAINTAIFRQPDMFSIDFTSPVRSIENAANLLGKVPTQTNRSAEKDAFQQYSTPPTYALLAQWVAKGGINDIVLEPSAGTGSLVSSLSTIVKKVYVNELSERRRLLLSEFNPARIYGENAEQLNNILQPRLPMDQRPTVVVMNPPFSQTAGRLKGKRQLDVGAKHIEQALQLLQPNGRLVAIVGRGMSFDAPTWRGWWQNIAREYTVRANVAVGGDVYKKFGTSFETRLLVIDKTGPSELGNAVTGEIMSLNDAEAVGKAATLLKGVRDARPVIQPAGEALQPSAPEAGPVTEGDNAERPRTDAMGRGATDQAGVSTEAQGEVRPGAGDAGATERSGAGRQGAVGQRRRTAARAGGEPGGQQPGTPGDRAATPAQPGTTASDVAVERVTTKTGGGELRDSVFEPYTPQKAVLKGTTPHPTPLVQSAAMASVEPPDPTYSPRLKPEQVKALSNAQGEAIVYAGMAHQRELPDGTRQGFFIGDGTGVGKGREIAGIFADNFNRGQTKGVWISLTPKLFEDAKRDAGALGIDPKSIMLLNKVKSDQPIAAKSGIVFAGYDTLKQKHDVPAKARWKQIADWLGADFDGVIAFDEAHAMKNAIAQKGKRGNQQPSDTAAAAALLQAALPKAKIVYVSATGATEVANLAYADRLGLWGQGTPFPTKQEFVTQMEAGGVAAMEAVARDMKMQGKYIARSLSFDGIEYDRLTHVLNPEQREIYDKAAEGWQVVLRNFNAALELTAQSSTGKVDARAKAAAMSIFWSNQQRFFNRLLTSLQMPSVIGDIKKQLSAGNSAVLQIVDTNEAATDRALADIDEDTDLSDLDLSPKQQLIEMVQNAFPVAQYEEYMDEAGAMRMRPVTDRDGKPVQNPQAVAMRDKLVDDLASIRIPDAPIDMLLREFGPEQVAENTGRSRRLIPGTDKSGAPTIVQETWSKSKSLADVKAFNDGRKRILIFSAAGGTGASYHADRGFKNQQRRIHYLVQAGWSADKAVQGFGRTHRSNQTQTPLYQLVQTDVLGQKRFISTIARRLDQLGALTKGQRQAGSSGIFKAADNLESTEARDAMTAFFKDLTTGRVNGIDETEFTQQTGLRLRDAQGNVLQQLPPVTQFLNRLLALQLDRQNIVFEAFDERLQAIVRAKASAGLLDVGVETLRADGGIEKVSEQEVHKDTATGATSSYVVFEAKQSQKRFTFDDINRGRATHGERVVKYAKNTRGTVYAFTDGGTRTNSSMGIVEDVYRQWGITHAVKVSKREIDDGENWTTINEDEARAAWDRQYKATPEYRTDKLHLVTGSLLPIWDRIVGKPRIFRLQTSAGVRFLGRVIDNDTLNQTLQRLGVAGTKVSLEEAWRSIRDGGATAVLSNGWRIKRSRVQGEDRIELVGPSFSVNNIFDRIGVIREKIAYQMRYFIPNTDAGIDVLRKAIEGQEIIQVIGGYKLGNLDAEQEAAMQQLQDQPGPGAPLDAELASTLGTIGEQLELEGDYDSHAFDAKVSAPTPAIKVAPLPGGQSKTLRAIINDFGESLQKMPRLGVKHRRNVGGTYFPDSTRTTIRFAGDLATVAHELAGHFIDDRYGVLQQWYKNRARSPYDAELIPHFSAHGSVARSGPRAKLSYQRAEGLAEWVKAWVLNPQAAEAAAPTFTAFFKSKVPASTMDKIKAFSDDVRKFAGQSATGMTRSNVNMQLTPEQTGLLEKLQGIASADVLKTELVDEFWPIHKAILEAKAATRADLDARNDPAVLLQLFAGERSRVEDAIENGVPLAYTLDERAPDVDGGLSWMLEPLAAGTKKGDLASLQEETADGIAFLINRRVVYKAKQWRDDVEDQIKLMNPLDPKYAQRTKAMRDAVELRIQRMAGTGGGLYSDEGVALQSLKELASDQAKMQRLELFADRYEATARGLLRYMLDKGRISSESYQHILNRNEIYADMHRLVRDELLDGRPSLSQKIGTTSEPIKRFKGGTWEINNPVVNLIEQIASVVHETDRNEVKQSFAELLTTGRQMHDGPAVDLDQIGSRAKAGDPDTIKLYRNGKAEFWQFRPDVYKAMRTVGEIDDLGPVLKAVSIAVKRIPQRLITQSPAFVVRQLFRDPIVRAIISRVGSKPLTAFKSFPKLDRDRIKRLGGTEAGLYAYDEGWAHLMHRKLAELAGDKRTLLIDPRNWWKWWSDQTADLGDTRTRLAEFTTALEKFRKQGMDDYDAGLLAAKEARELIDYAVAGRAVRKAMPFILFLNPAIQGPLRSARAFREAPARTAGRWALYIMVPRLVLAALRAMLDQEEEYDQLPAWRRDFFLNIKIPGTSTWLSLPQPYELGVLGAGVERAIDLARGKRNSFAGFEGSLAKSLIPVDEFAIGGAFRGMVENMTNYSFFFDRSIVPEWEADLDPALRDPSRSSRLGKGLALLGRTIGLDNVADLDPRYVDNMLYNMGGGVARIAMDLSDMGRDDKDASRFLGSGVGLFTGEPISSSADVQWVQREAKRLGDTQSKEIKALREAINAYYSAETKDDRDAAAKDVWALARDLRGYYQENAEEILQRKVEKRAASTDAE